MLLRLALCLCPLALLVCIGGCIQSEAEGTSPQVRVASVIKDPEQKARVLIEVAKSQVRKNRNSGAEDPYDGIQEAMDMARQSIDDVSEANSRVPLLASLAGLMISGGQDKDAKLLIEQAVKDVEKVEDPKDKIKSVILLSEKLIAIDEYDLTGLQIEAVAESATKVGDSTDIIENMLSLIGASSKIEKPELLDKLASMLTTRLQEDEDPVMAAQNVGDVTSKMALMQLIPSLPPVLETYKGMTAKLPVDKRAPNLVEICERYCDLEDAKEAKDAMRQLEEILKDLTGEANSTLKGRMGGLQSRIDLLPSDDEEAVTEPKKEEAKAEPKKEEAKAEPKKEEAKAEPKKEEAKAEPKKEEAKAEPKKEEAKAEPKKEEAKKDE